MVFGMAAPSASGCRSYALIRFTGKSGTLLAFRDQRMAMTVLTWHGVVTVLSSACTLVVAVLAGAALFSVLTWSPCWYALGVRLLLALVKQQTRSMVLKASK
jgi:hypothetical protein